MLLDGRVTVITGAGGGIGREIAVLFAAEGARVAAFDRDRGPGERLVEELRAGGADRPFFVAGDVRSAPEVEEASERVVDEAGRIDVLVNCAGVREIGDVYELPADEWENVIAVNLSGVFYWCQSAARRMRKTGGGSILNIASVGGLVGLSHRPAYTASKHGVVGLSKSLARDLAADKIRVNAICPGLIRTPLTEQYFADEQFGRDLELVIPQGRAGTAGDVAQAALYLASDMASYVSGIALTVDGGWLAEKSFAATGAQSTAFHKGHDTNE
jgi:NAD(P)-dependent dehydrogenase (short-subunit alcohol dehydrogenase family)